MSEISNERLLQLYNEAFDAGDFPPWFAGALELAHVYEKYRYANKPTVGERNKIVEELEIRYQGFKACLIEYDALVEAYLSLESTENS